MSRQAKAAFFDGLAPHWDDGQERFSLAAALEAGLEGFALGGEETVLEVGCGTGNLTAALLPRLSLGGRVVALDISLGMVAVARAKVGDRRVGWVVAAAEALPLREATCHRAVCLGVWPHLEDPGAAAKELARVLSPHGKLHIWHLSSREEINRVHAAAGGPVAGDLLPPAAEVANLLSRCGFVVTTRRDDEGGYLVSARRGEEGG